MRTFWGGRSGAITRNYQRMIDSGAGAYDAVARDMRQLADQALQAAGEITLLFVTNLRTADVVDIGDDGILNTAQHYTRPQAEEIIRSLQALGVTVRAFFSEADFLSWTLAAVEKGDIRNTVVFTTAEGGSGSGRRALIPSFCNLVGLPVLNSGAHACSVARHKFHANAILAKVGVRSPQAWLYKSDEWLGEQQPAPGTRVILKPMYESMCIGIGDDSVIVINADAERIIGEKHRTFRQPVLVQEFISGEEVGVPLVRIGSTRALPPVAFRRANGDPYGHQPKTFDDENVHHDTSFDLYDAGPELREAIRRAAVLAFDALEMRGVGRVDLRIDADGRTWVFDTNESPPPLARTSYATAMASLGFSLEEMLALWLGVCLRDYELISGV
jgi:D-alanine-D-alanine ligase